MERSVLYEILSTEYANWDIEPKPLGNGSYGVVFKMTNRSTSEIRALKAIPIPHDDTDIDKRRGSGFTEEEIKRDYTAIKDRVLDEIVNVIQLRGNENVVRVHGYREIRQKDQIGWIVCFDMEYLPPMKEVQPMNERGVIKLGLDICNALKDCHEKNIIHRDIKPQNILKRGDTHVLVDFGESKMAKSQSSLSMRGTYDYMAPELLRQQRYSDVAPGTVDIYSLGITLYLFSNHNRLPFLNTLKEMMYSDARDEANIRRWNSPILPRPSGVSERLGSIILCATQPDPRRRYQNAADMEHDLQRVDTDEPLICDRINPLTPMSADSAQAYTPAQRMNYVPVQPVQNTSTPVMQSQVSAVPVNQVVPGTVAVNHIDPQRVSANPVTPPAPALQNTPIQQSIPVSGPMTVPLKNYSQYSMTDNKPASSVTESKKVQKYAEKKKPGKRKIKGLVIAGCLLLIIIVVGIVVYVNSQSGNDKKTNTVYRTSSTSLPKQTTTTKKASKASVPQQTTTDNFARQTTTNNFPDQTTTNNFPQQTTTDNW